MILKQYTKDSLFDKQRFEIKLGLDYHCYNPLYPSNL